MNHPIRVRVGYVYVLTEAFWFDDGPPIRKAHFAGRRRGLYFVSV